MLPRDVYLFANLAKGLNIIQDKRTRSQSITRLPSPLCDKRLTFSVARKAPSGGGMATSPPPDGVADQNLIVAK